MEFMVFLAIIVVIGLVIVLIYNRLVALRQTTRQAWGDIDVQLKQRHDLVPNLVETVKGYAAHESQTLENVVKARQQAVDASSVKDLAQAENMLSGALRQLFALSEAYPDLKANQNFLKLQNELADLENKIAAARRFFNNAVSELRRLTGTEGALRNDSSLRQIDNFLIANVFGMVAGISGQFSTLLEIGISTGDDFDASSTPTLRLDEDTFREALRGDRRAGPAGIRAGAGLDAVGHPLRAGGRRGLVHHCLARLPEDDRCGHRCADRAPGR